MSSDSLSPQQVDGYLARIGVARPTSLDVEAVDRLHLAHQRTVPFENLDIHLDVPIVLDVDALFDKIVRRRRGGFCYELNGLFAALLRSLGYGIELFQARVFIDGADAAVGIPFDHLCVRATTVDDPVPTDLLVDVGFGSSFAPTPLRLRDESPQEAGGVTFAIAPLDIAVAADPPLDSDNGDDWWVLRRNDAPTYVFSQRPRQLADCTTGSQHHQTSPDSHFTQGTVCSLLTPTGRITVTDRTLRSTVDGVQTTRDLESGDDLASVLDDHFNVQLTDAQALTLWHRVGT